MSDATAVVNIELNFVSFFREQYQSIFADAYFILGNQDDALEIADEAFFRAYLKWKKISTYEKPGAWLRRIAIRLSVRRKTRKQRESGEFVDTAAPHHDREAQIDLHRAMMQLSPQQRAATTLFYFDDLPVADVADAMNCSESTVKRHLFDARERLRLLLS